MELVKSRLVCIESSFVQEVMEGPRQMRSVSAATPTCQAKEPANVFPPVQLIFYNHSRI